MFSCTDPKAETQVSRSKRNNNTYKLESDDIPFQSHLVALPLPLPLPLRFFSSCASLFLAPTVAAEVKEAT